MGTVGKEILFRWKNGDGNWLDLAKSEYKQEAYYLDFREIHRGERTLQKVFGRLEGEIKEEDLITCVVMLDSIYHTRMPNPIRWARLLYEREDFLKIIETIKSAKRVEGNLDAINSVLFLSELDKKEAGGSYTYSFATKFSNWLNNEFPIFDRFVAGTIYKKENDESFPISAMGDYSFFVSKYSEIKDEKYKLENLSYKEIDICMWTYAKIHKLAWGDDLGVDVEYKKNSV